MIPKKLFLKSIALFWILCFLNHSTPLHSEESIYLPFPDLPQEILNPGMESLQSDSSNTKDTVTTNGIHNPKKEAKKNQISIRKNDSQESITKSNQESSPSNKKEDQSILSESKESKTLVNDNKTSGSKSKTLENDSNMSISDSKTLDSDSELGLLQLEDRKKFQKAMEEIRKKESKDPDSAITEYQKLREKYKSPELQSKVLISQAWNFYHRNKNSECLEILIRILESKSLIHTSEYPTALYLAGEIHDRPWAGRNRNFRNRYFQIFRENYQAGKPNFQSSLYARKILNEI